MSKGIDYGEATYSPFSSTTTRRLTLHDILIPRMILPLLFVFVLLALDEFPKHMHPSPLRKGQNPGVAHYIIFLKSS